MATAVISASEGMHYASHVIPALPVLEATIGLLAFFMCLTIWGIKESAVLAIGIFLFHISSLILRTSCSSVAPATASPTRSANSAACG